MKQKMWIYFSVWVSLLLPAHIQAVELPQTHRVGVLIPESQRPESQIIRGLRDGLKELGYNERKNIRLEIRNAKGDRAALSSMASELVSRKIQLFVTTGTRATQTAQGVANGIPIVFLHPADPVALGLVKSLERPGGNTTGVAGLALQMTEKRMEALKKIAPKVQRVLIFYDSNNPYSRENFLSAQKAAVKLGLEISAYPIKTAEELKNSLSRVQQSDGHALFHIPDDLVEGQMEFIYETARQRGLPTMFNEEVWAIQGGLAAFGPSYLQMGRQAARLADKILKGEKPGNLPVEQANKFDLVINFRAANAIGLTVPPEVLKKADKVIR